MKVRITKRCNRTGFYKETVEEMTALELDFWLELEEVNSDGVSEVELVVTVEN